MLSLIDLSLVVLRKPGNESEKQTHNLALSADTKSRAAEEPVMRIMTMCKNSVFIFFTAILFCSVSTGALADDALVIKAKSLSAKHFDETLTAQPIEKWLRMHIPAEYEVVWGEYITDCGENTESLTDKKRDIPLCAEVEIRKGTKLLGYLALFVGTQKRGLLNDSAGVYFGYLEHQGTKYNFRKLSDILNIEQPHNKAN